MTTNLILNNRANRKGLYLILIRVTKNRKHYATSSEIYIKKNEFNKKADYGKWIVKHLDRDRLNNAIKTKITSVERIYQLNEDVSPQRAIKSDSFFKFGEEFIEKYNTERSLATYKAYKAKFAKLKKYAGAKLTFSDLTVGFIRQYINHLQTSEDHKNTINTISVDLKKIKAVFNQAIKEGIVRDTPFKLIQIKTEKAKKERLTIEELVAIRNLDLGNSHYHARNIFLFCINCNGMRIGDALRLKWKSVSGDRLIYQMNKTKDAIPIKLTTEAQKIIEYYDKNHQYIFPYLRGCKKGQEYQLVNSGTAVINHCLESIGEWAGIDKHITTHVARHTWTQLAINNKANPRTIQKALGHDSFNTTENYISDLDFNDVDDINEKIFK